MKQTVVLSTPASFSFEHTVESHGWYQLAPFVWQEDTKKLKRIETIDDKTSVELSISWRGGRLFVESNRDLTRLEPLLKKRLARMFQLHVELSDFHSLCERSDSHRDVARTGFGRLLCGSTPFEDAVKIICTTNTTWRQTRRMVELLVAHFGVATAAGDRGFPVPQSLIRQSADALQQQCRLGYRAAFIHRLASGIVDGSIDLTALGDPGRSTEDLYLGYKSLPGIGPYGAAHLLAMDGRHDFIAVDSEFRRFVRDRYHRGRRVKDSTMLKRYNKWGRWKYLAYWSELWNG